MADPINPNINHNINQANAAQGAKFDESIGLRLVVNFNQWIEGLRKSEDAVTGFGTVVEEISKAIPKGFEDQQRRLESVLNSITTKINGVRNTFLKWEAGLAATTLAMAHHSAGLERSMYMMERLAERTGKSVSSVYKVIEQNMGGVAAKADLIRASVHMMNTEFNPAQMDKFVKIVKDASAAMGTDFAHSMEFAVKSVQTLNTHLLTNIGLVIRQEEVMTKAMQKNPGLAADQLTSQMKQDAMLTLIEERSKKFAGSHDQLMGRGTYQWSDMKQNLSDISEELGRVFIPAWAKAAKTITGFTSVLKSIVQSDTFQAIGKVLANVIIPAVTTGSLVFTVLSGILTALTPIIAAIPFVGLALGIYKVTAALRGNQGLTPALREAGTVIGKTWMGMWDLMTKGTWSAIKAIMTYKNEVANVKTFGLDMAKDRSKLAGAVPGLDPSKLGMSKEAVKLLKQQTVESRAAAVEAKNQLEKDFSLKEQSFKKLYGPGGRESALLEMRRQALKQTGKPAGSMLERMFGEVYDTGSAAYKKDVETRNNVARNLVEYKGLMTKIDTAEKSFMKEAEKRVAARTTPIGISAADASVYAAKTESMKNALNQMKEAVAAGGWSAVSGPFIADIAKQLGMSMDKGILGNIRALFGGVSTSASKMGSEVGGTLKALSAVFQSTFGMSIPKAIGMAMLSIAKISAQFAGMIIFMQFIGAIFEKWQKNKQEQEFGSDEFEQEAKQLEERRGQLNKEWKKRNEEFVDAKSRNYTSTDDIKAKIAESKGAMSVEEIKKLATGNLTQEEINAAKRKRATLGAGNLISSVLGPAVGMFSDTAGDWFKTQDIKRKREEGQLGVNWETYYGAKTLKQNVEGKSELENMSKSVISLSSNMEILNKGLDKYIAAERGAGPVFDGVTTYLRERLSVYASLSLKHQEYVKYLKDLDKQGPKALDAMEKKYLAQRIFVEGTKKKIEDVRYKGAAEGGGSWQVRVDGQWTEAPEYGSFSYDKERPGIRTGEAGRGTRGERLRAMSEIDRTKELSKYSAVERNKAEREMQAVRETVKVEGYFQEGKGNAEIQKLENEVYLKEKSKLVAQLAAVDAGPNIEDLVKSPEVREEARKRAEDQAALSTTKQKNIQTPEQFMDTLIENNARSIAERKIKEMKAASVSGGATFADTMDTMGTPDTSAEELSAKNMADINEKARVAAQEAVANIKKIMTTGLAETGYSAVKAMMDKMAEAVVDSDNFDVFTDKALKNLEDVEKQVAEARVMGIDEGGQQRIRKQAADEMKTLEIVWFNRIEKIKANSKTLMALYAADRRMMEEAGRQETTMPGGLKASRYAVGLDAVERTITDIEEAQKDFSLENIRNEFIHTQMVWEDMNKIVGKFLPLLARVGAEGIQSNEVWMKTLKELEQHYATLSESFVNLYDKALEKQKQMLLQTKAIQKEEIEYGAKVKESATAMIEAERNIQAARRESASRPTPGFAAATAIAQMKATVMQTVGGRAGEAETVDREIAKVVFEETQKQRTRAETQIGQGSPEDIVAQITKVLGLISQELQGKVQLAQMGGVEGRTAREDLKGLGGAGYEEEKVKALNAQKEQMEAKIAANKIRVAELGKNLVEIESRAAEHQHQLQLARLKLEANRQQVEFELINAQRKQTEDQLAAATIWMKAIAIMYPNQGIEKLVSQAEALRDKNTKEGTNAVEVQEKLKKSNEELMAAIESNTNALLGIEKERAGVKANQRNVQVGLPENPIDITIPEPYAPSAVTNYGATASTTDNGMTTWGSQTAGWKQSDGTYSNIGLETPKKLKVASSGALAAARNMEISPEQRAQLASEDMNERNKAFASLGLDKVGISAGLNPGVGVGQRTGLEPMLNAISALPADLRKELQPLVEAIRVYTNKLNEAKSGPAPVSSDSPAPFFPSIINMRSMDDVYGSRGTTGSW